MAAKLPNMDGTFGILYAFLNSIEIMVFFTVFLFELPAETAQSHQVKPSSLSKKVRTSFRKADNRKKERPGGKASGLFLF